MAAIRCSSVVLSALLLVDAVLGLEPHSLCGQGVGDLAATTENQAFCTACLGPSAVLVHSSSTGLSTCLPEKPQLRSVAALLPPSAACGEGFGDRTTSWADQAACRRCLGRNAVLVHKRTAHPSGYSICYPSLPPHLRNHAELGLEAEPSTVSLAASTSGSQAESSSTCGQGVGDKTADEAARNSCLACGGRGLHFYADTVGDKGFTVCVAASTPAAPVLAAQFSCGEAVGDKTQEATNLEACRSCVGTNAELRFDSVANDGVGYTSCHQAHPPKPVEQSNCGSAIGRHIADPENIAACAACGGDLNFDLSGADGLGYTACVRNGRPVSMAESAVSEDLVKPQRLYKPQTCGQGVGDHSLKDANEAACKLCTGETGRLFFSPTANDGTGYTFCLKGSRLVMFGEACGSSIGDSREDSGALDACNSCGGALLFDASAADGLGYTACRSPKTQTRLVATQSKSCGDGVGDRRDSEANHLACKSCMGTTASLVFDASANDGLGHTVCTLASNASVSSSEKEILP